MPPKKTEKFHPLKDEPARLGSPFNITGYYGNPRHSATRFRLKAKFVPNAGQPPLGPKLEIKFVHNSHLKQGGNGFAGVMELEEKTGIYKTTGVGNWVDMPAGGYTQLARDDILLLTLPGSQQDIRPGTTGEFTALLSVDAVEF